jgi:hypothetical protein
MQILNFLNYCFVKKNKKYEHKNIPWKLIKLNTNPNLNIRTEQLLKLNIINMIIHILVPLHGHQMLKVFSIPFKVTCSLLFSNYGLLKLSIGMVCFSKFEISKHKKHWSLLFIHQEQNYSQSCIPTTKKEKLQRKIQVNWFKI